MPCERRDTKDTVLTLVSLKSFSPGLVTVFLFFIDGFITVPAM